MKKQGSFIAQAAIAQNEKTGTNVSKAVQEYRNWKISVIFSNLFVVLGALLTIFLICAGAKSAVQTGYINFAWLLEVIPQQAQDISDFASVLAPLLAISVAIERMIEQIFDYLEKSLVNVADFLDAPVKLIQEIKKEYQQVNNAVETARLKVQTMQTTTAALELKEAEQLLADLEEGIRNTTKEPEYIAWKRSWSILIAFLLGLLVAVWGDLGMLRTIGIPTPRIFDMLVTGLVIGAGPGPMHSIIGILQSGKDALTKLGNLGTTSPTQESIDLITTEIAKANASLENTLSDIKTDLMDIKSTQDQ